MKPVPSLKRSRNAGAAHLLWRQDLPTARSLQILPVLVTSSGRRYASHRRRCGVCTHSAVPSALQTQPQGIEVYLLLLKWYAQHGLRSPTKNSVGTGGTCSRGYSEFVCRRTNCHAAEDSRKCCVECRCRQVPTERHLRLRCRPLPQCSDRDITQIENAQSRQGHKRPTWLRR